VIVDQDDREEAVVHGRQAPATGAGTSSRRPA
jgi:hypothetical protein